MTDLAGQPDWPLPGSGKRWTRGQLDGLKALLNREGKSQAADAIGSIQLDDVDARAELDRLRATNAALVKERAVAIEIRNGDDGALDEIIISVGGTCVFHLEQMDANRWWMGCYESNNAPGVMVYLNARGKISATVMDQRTPTEAPQERQNG